MRNKIKMNVKLFANCVNWISKVICSNYILKNFVNKNLVAVLLKQFEWIVSDLRNQEQFSLKKAQNE